MQTRNRMIKEKNQGAVIVACGGQGTRLGSGVAKQFLKVAGRPILAYTLDLLQNHPRIERIVLVVPRQWWGMGREGGRIMAEAGLEIADYPKLTAVIVGGDTRQASVSRGLAALGDWQGPVLVHDGVRPLTEPAVFDRVLDSVLEWGTGVAALPVTDTVKRADSLGWVQETLPRQGLWQIQTPQGFFLPELRQAYEAAGETGVTGTDDAALLEALGRPVRLVEGDPWNIKITYPADLELMALLLERRQFSGEPAGRAARGTL